VTATAQGLQIKNANAATLRLSAATNYRAWNDLGADGVAVSRSQLAAAQGKSYGALVAAHLSDYRGLFRRVSIDLGAGPGGTLPTGKNPRDGQARPQPSLADHLRHPE
jgi:alpha-L-fucosidase 2